MKERSLGMDILLTTLVLVIIAVVAGGILAGVNALTYQTPDEKLDAKLSAVYKTSEGFTKFVYDEKDKDKSKIDFVKDKEDKKLGGRVMGLYVPVKNDKNEVLVHVRGNGAYDKDIEIIVIIDKNKEEIKGILEYRSGETPGLGANAFKPKHIEKYLGDFSKVDKFELSKVNPNAAHKIDAVTGATKTSTAFNNAINTAILFYRSDLYKTLMGGIK